MMVERNSKGQFVLGHKPTKEMIEKVKSKLVGRKESIEIKKAKSERMKKEYLLGIRKPAMKGKKLTLEAKNNISEKLKLAYKDGRRLPIKMNGKDNPFYGKTHTEESIRKIKIANIGRKQSKETIEKRIRKGKEASNWRGGITKKNRLLRSNKLWRVWREEVFRKDNFTCQNKECKYCNNIRGKEIQPHHIKPICLFPELVYDVSNGVTFCKGFHLKSGLHKKLIGGKIKNVD